MESGGGLPALPATPGFPRPSQDPSSDPDDPPRLSVFSAAIMANADFQRLGCGAPLVCGGISHTLELDSPCGSPSPLTALVPDVGRSSLRPQSSTTLRPGGVGTNGSILHAVSGAHSLDASQTGPCGSTELCTQRSAALAAVCLNRLLVRRALAAPLLPVSPPRPCVQVAEAPLATSCMMPVVAIPRRLPRLTLAVRRGCVPIGLGAWPLRP